MLVLLVKVFPHLRAESMTNRLRRLQATFGTRAEAPELRSAGLRQLRTARAACKGRQSYKAALAAQRKAIVTEAAFGCLRTDLQVPLITDCWRGTKVRQHSSNSIYADPSGVFSGETHLLGASGQRQEERVCHELSLFASDRLCCKSLVAQRFASGSWFKC